MFLGNRKDRFGNPVGYIIADSAEKIFDEFVNNNNNERIKLLLKEIIKIRAVQDFTPSQAAGFIFSLKEVIYKELELEVKSSNYFNEFILIDAGIDNIALMSFDLFMEAREKIFQLRTSEIRSRSMKIID